MVLIALVQNIVSKVSVEVLWLRTHQAAFLELVFGEGTWEVVVVFSECIGQP